ncbi:enoyl-CoA hydratase-related protein [Silvimonas amylolytica]|uniref:Enoyl-CoA hydratase n=1 Tax=Silvimonas amylolytica TaxID=449663 RepID=A0ABQ2PI70_9NEIS|nr:enoyl-CoA hydratase-related protein [Silvimonas amylolytica]GGP24674.1 enoyl-CoA hydratase [Silvimonas amylolytica]
MSDTLRLEMDPAGVATITFSRPETSNSVDDILVAELTASLAALAQNPHLRALVLRSDGDTFCSGNDVRWLAHMSNEEQHDNFEQALRLARMMQALDRLPAPVLAQINGPAMGVGVGIIACCDMVVATSQAWFCLPETRIGLVPAIIAPYIVGKIGTSAARRYFLTAERFGPGAAAHCGLIHEVMEDETDAARQIKDWLDHLLLNGPHAVGAAKRLIATVAWRAIDDSLLSDTAHRIAHMRTREEAREGIAALSENRAPWWVPHID